MNILKRTATKLPHDMTIPIVIVLLAALLFMLPPILNMPFGRDQGIFAWVAQTLLQGGLPYVDAFDNKGPVTFYLYAFAFQAGGDAATSVRALDIFLLLLCLAAMIELARHWGSAQAGWLAALLVLSLSSLNFWNLGQPDLWAGELAIVMLWLFLKTPSPSRMIAAGLLAGLILALKIPYALLPAVLTAFLLFEKNYRQALFFAAGVSVVPFVFIAIYAFNGQLQTLWEVTFTYNFYVYADVPDQHFWRDLLTLRLFWPVNTALSSLCVLANDILLLLLAAGGLWVMWGEGRRREVKVLVLLWAATYAVITLQAKFFFYHYTMLLLLTTLPAAMLLGRAKKWDQQAVVAFLILLLALPHLFFAGKLLEWWQGIQSRTEWQAALSWGDFNYGLVAEAAEYIRQNTQPTDKVFLWGVDSLIYTLSQRMSPTRFGYNHPLVLAQPPLRQTFVEELETDIGKQPPVFIIVQLNDQNDVTPPSITTLPDFPALVALLQREYRVRWENKAFRIYERVPLAQSP